MSKCHSKQLLFIAVCLAVSPMAATMVAEAQEPDHIHFHDSYNAAIQEAKLTQKPIFLEFRCAP